MSTKTTFKRVALVAVASMGFGLLSVVPSSATPLGDTLVLDVTGTTSATVGVGETATAVVTQKFTSLASGDSMSVQAVLTDYPTGGSAAVIKLDTSDSLTGTVSYASGTSSSSAGGASTVAYVGHSAAGSIMAAYNVRIVGAPVAGTYKVGLFATKYTGATASAASAPSLSWTVVVTAADVNASPALTTSLIAAGVATPAVVDSATVSGPMAVTSTQAATILVTQANAAGTANESMTVIVSGPGVVSGQSGNSGSRSVNAGRAITVQNGHSISVFSDGSSGVATITITGSTSKAVLGVETVTFYGAVATITTTVRTAVVSSLGGATSGASALVAVVKDSLGTVIPTGSVYAQSGTTASIPDATCTYSSTYKGHACSLVPVAGKTGSVTFTVRNAVRATTVAATTISAADVSVTLGEAPAKLAMSFDKSVYGQGEAAKLSLTLTDKNGKPVANGIYTNILDADMIESTYTLTGLVDTHTVTAATSTGTMVISVNMPIAEVDIAVTGTTGTGFATLADQDVAVKAGVVSVKSNSSSAATDAANEATDAANAATDAANAAAEAADAATAAAQDAADAVAALSTEVAGLIAALKAQITSLTNLVIKIQKKVKA
ncbi:MAG: hypothetical protein NTZ06_03055 [Actinobacteria bacterium]|nr:hypothetical protein [Actinomycetota bacterium]